jgi:hypothetical protein
MCFSYPINQRNLKHDGVSSRHDTNIRSCLKKFTRSQRPGQDISMIIIQSKHSWLSSSIVLHNLMILGHRHHQFPVPQWLRLHTSKITHTLIISRKTSSSHTSINIYTTISPTNSEETNLTMVIWLVEEILRSWTSHAISLLMSPCKFPIHSWWNPWIYQNINPLSIPNLPNTTSLKFWMLIRLKRHKV